MSSYGKLDEYDQARHDANQRAKKRITIIALSSFLLLCIVIGAVVGTTVNKKPSKDNGDEESLSVSVKAVCDVTLHKEKCILTIGSAPNSSTLTPQELFNYALEITKTELYKVLTEFKANNITEKAMESCVELIDLAIDQLNETITQSTLIKNHDDLRTWLSSVLTYQETCMEELMETNQENLKKIGEIHLKDSRELTSNALAIITWLGKISKNLKLRRRLLTMADLDFKRRLMLESDVIDLRKMANLVVAKNGSGKYKTINGALEDVVEKSENLTIIYVKEGVYLENVRIEKKKWNVVMVGDGQSKTIVSAKLNFVDGTPTFQTATFAVFGKGFMAKDMSFKNTAGPAKHQAVALMSSADFSVFYRCTMDAFQDTLYAHAQRQFYRDCNIFGTVDFMFGNAAVIFQNCTIKPRRPLKGQQNTITAQGKKDPNQNTGISIHKCKFLPLDNLKGIKTFLGRPWKDFSTTVIMKSFIDGFVDPKGWLPWTGESAPDTIFYGEYMNSGIGGLTKDRVKWKGLKTNLKEKEAKKFMVKPFIDGHQWLPVTKVPFTSDL